MAISSATSNPILDLTDVGEGMGDAEKNMLQGVVDALQAARGELNAMLDSADPADRAAIQGAIADISSSIASVKSSITTGSRSGASSALVGAGIAISAVKERVAGQALDEAQTAITVATNQETVFLKNSEQYVDSTLVNNFSWYNGLDDNAKRFFKEEVVAADMSKMAKINSSFSAAVVTANIIQKDAGLSKDLEATREANREAMKEAKAYALKNNDKELDGYLSELSGVLAKQGKTSGKDNANDYSMKKDWEAFEKGEITREQLIEKIKAETQQRSKSFEVIKEQTLSLFTSDQQSDLKELITKNTGIANPTMEDMHKYGLTTKVNPSELNKAMWEINQGKTEEEKQKIIDNLPDAQKEAYLVARLQTNFQLQYATDDLKQYFSKMNPEERAQKIDQLLSKISEGREGREEVISIMETAMGRKLDESTMRTIRDSKDPKTLEVIINGITKGEDVRSVHENMQEHRFKFAMGKSMPEGINAGLFVLNDNVTENRELLKSFDLFKAMETGNIIVSTLDPATSAPLMEGLKFVDPEKEKNSRFAQLLGQNNFNSFAGIPVTNPDLVAKSQSQTIIPIAYNNEDPASLGGISPSAGKNLDVANKLAMAR